MNKLSILILMMAFSIFATSCGKKGSGGQSLIPSPSNPVSERCNVFSKNDSLEQIAINSNRARIECNLNEEETLALVKNI